MQNQSTSDTEPRIVNIDGTLNFRDLGGYKTQSGQTVKWGKLYRSAQLDRLTDSGIQTLAALDVAVVVDLRFSDESHSYPTIQAAVPDAEMLSWHDELQANQDEDLNKSQTIRRGWRDSLDSNDPSQVREAMRVNYPVKLYSHRAIYRKMLLRLSQGKTPLLFHCAAGKDRTGVAAALILSLLGVDDQQIIEDYLITQSLLEGRLGAWLAGGATTQSEYQEFQQKLAEQPEEMLKPVFDADRAYIETLLDYVATTYTSFEQYALQKLKLSSDDLANMRHELLE